MAPKVSGFAVAEMAVGGILLYSGLKGTSLKDTVTGLTKGQLATAKTEEIGTPKLSASYGQAADSSSASSSGSAAAGDTSAHSGTAKSNQAIAKILAAPYGWATGSQWADLVSLWNRESGWNNKADNPTSGAYGIAQALPSTKYPVAGRPPSEGGSSSATTQIAWGLSYIKQRYGSPSAAWAHETSQGWY